MDRQHALGLYGALIIDPATPDPTLATDHEYTLPIQEWLKREELIYRHVGHHTANNNVETGGGGRLMMVIDVAGP